LGCEKKHLAWPFVASLVSVKHTALGLRYPRLTLKAMQDTYNLTFLPYLISETYSRKYENVLNIVINACTDIIEKNICWKYLAGTTVLFISIWHISSKQLNTLTTILTISWLGGAEVTHPLWVREVPGSIPGSAKRFYVWYFICLLLWFCFLSKTTHHLSQCFSISFAKCFSILNILHDLWPIIMV